MVIRPEQQTVADVFKSAGYTTGAIGKWHLGMGDKAGTQDWNGVVTPGPRDLGFDYSYLMAATGDRVPCVWIENQRVANYDADAPIYVSYKEPFAGEPLGKDHPELLTKLKPYPNHGHNQAIVNGISRIGYMKGGGKALWQDENIADTIAAKAVRFIENHKDTTFFLYVGTNDIHVPRYPHARFAGKSGMGYRGDAILQFDWTVGEIMKALKKQGIVENTMIVLTSDNGPVVNDGYQDQAIELLGDHRPWGELRGGKYSIFEAGTRVPFIVSWPAKVIPGVSDALVSHIDLFASMAELAGGRRWILRLWIAATNCRHCWEKIKKEGIMLWKWHRHYLYRMVNGNIFLLATVRPIVHLPARKQDARKRSSCITCVKTSAKKEIWRRSIPKSWKR